MVNFLKLINLQIIKNSALHLHAVELIVLRANALRFIITHLNLFHHPALSVIVLRAASVATAELRQQQHVQALLPLVFNTNAQAETLSTGRIQSRPPAAVEWVLVICSWER